MREYYSRMDGLPERMRKAGSPGRGTRAAGMRFTIAFDARPVMKAKALQGSVNYPSLKGGACERLSETKQ